MMPVYATVGEFMAHLDPDSVPANAARLLKNASRRLDGVLIGARYDTDTDGMPTDPKIVDLFREAVCLQAQYIADLGDETGANANVNSQRVGGVATTRALSLVGGGTPRVSPEMIELLRTSPLAQIHPFVGGWQCSPSPPTP
jgi:hypothetical protein